MKALLVIIPFALLLCGCRTIYKAEVPTMTFPYPGTSLSEFLKNPVDGVYALPDVAPMPADYFRYNILVVSAGISRLARYQDGRVSTNVWDFADYRPAFPSERVFQEFTVGTTQADVEQRLGKPTHEASTKIPYIGVKLKNPKSTIYSWFTLSPSSELAFMDVSVSYSKAKNGQRLVSRMTWAKRGGRRFSSKPHGAANGSQPFRSE